MFPPNCISTPNRKVSQGERKVFKVFRNCSKDFTILHSLDLPQHRYQTQGEIDFVVLVPKLGIFIIEVKGGGLKRKQGQWFSTNPYTNQERAIKDPFNQASDNMFSLIDKVKKELKIKNLLWGYGLICPAMPLSSIHVGDYEKWRLWDRNNMSQPIEEFIEILGRNEIKKQTDLGRRPTLLDSKTIDKIVDFLRPDFECPKLLSVDIDDISDRIDRYTKEQFNLLDNISLNPRIVVQGGAGTGKTLIATEATRRAVHNHKKVLFLSYNKQITTRVNYLLIKEGYFKYFPNPPVVKTFASFIGKYAFQNTYFLSEKLIEKFLSFQSVFQEMVDRIDELPKLLEELKDAPPISYNKPHPGSIMDIMNQMILDEKKYDAFLEWLRLLHKSDGISRKNIDGLGYYCLEKHFLFGMARDRELKKTMPITFRINIRDRNKTNIDNALEHYIDHFKIKKEEYLNGKPANFLNQADKLPLKDQYDYLIIDEAQDIVSDDGYLLAIDKMVKGGLKSGNWMMFMDTLQSYPFMSDKKINFEEIKKRLSEFNPVFLELTQNCRNTKEISTDISKVGITDPNYKISNIAGGDVGKVEYRYWENDSEDDQMGLQIVTNIIKKKLSQEGVSGDDIVILHNLRGDRSWLLPYGNRHYDARIYSKGNYKLSSKTLEKDMLLSPQYFEALLHLFRYEYDTGKISIIEPTKDIINNIRFGYTTFVPNKLAELINPKKDQTPIFPIQDSVHFSKKFYRKKSQSKTEILSEVLTSMLDINRWYDEEGKTLISNSYIPPSQKDDAQQDDHPTKIAIDSVHYIEIPKSGNHIELPSDSEIKNATTKWKNFLNRNINKLESPLRISTVHAFRGMDKKYVVLILDSSEFNDETRSLLYNGMSRAKAKLFVVMHKNLKEKIDKELKLMDKKEIQKDNSKKIDLFDDLMKK